MYYLLCIFITSLIFIWYIILDKRKLIKKSKENINQKLNEYRKESINNIDKEVENYKKLTDDKIKNLKQEVEAAIDETYRIITLQNEIREKNLEEQKKIEEIQLNTYKEQELRKINEEAAILKEQLDREYKRANDEYITQHQQLEGELNEILETLEDFKKRQSSINEAIRREEENQNVIDFHRIILSDNAKNDIKYLISIEHNLRNPTILYKLIWSEYLKRPFDQMIKNSFGSNIPKNVIYCIENINTHKKYIGKTSTEASKRWTEHIKTSLNIGTAKRSKIHDCLFNNWDEYTFSIIEEVPAGLNLSEREKYYIQLFETDKYGYNLTSGG